MTKATNSPRQRLKRLETNVVEGATFTAEEATFEGDVTVEGDLSVDTDLEVTGTSNLGGVVTLGDILSLDVRNVAGAGDPGPAGSVIYVSNGNAGSACIAVSNGTNWLAVSLGSAIAID